MVLGWLLLCHHEIVPGFKSFGRGSPSLHEGVPTRSLTDQPTKS